MSSLFAFPFYASFKADTTFWQEIKSKTFLHRLTSWLKLYKLRLQWVEHGPLENPNWMLQGEKTGAAEAPAHCQCLLHWSSHISLLYPVGFVFQGDYQCHHQAKLHPGTGVQPLWMPVGLHPHIPQQDFPHCIWNQFGPLQAECHLLPPVTQETFCFSRRCPN